MILKQLNKKDYENYLNYVKRVDKENLGSVLLFNEWLVKENKEGLLKYIKSECEKIDTR